MSAVAIPCGRLATNAAPPPTRSTSTDSAPATTEPDGFVTFADRAIPPRTIGPACHDIHRPRSRRRWSPGGYGSGAGVTTADATGERTAPARREAGHRNA